KRWDVIDVVSGEHHSDVVIVHDVTLSGDSKIGGNISCRPCKRSVPGGHAPDDSPPLESGDGTRSQVPRPHGLEGHLAIFAIVNTPGLVERLAVEHHTRLERHGLSVWTSPASCGCERIGAALDRCRPASQFHSEDHISDRPSSLFLTSIVLPLSLVVWCATAALMH